MDAPELSGLLYKRRGGFGKIMPNAWQYRFFCLTKDGVLQYYDTDMPDTDNLDKARGKVDLKNQQFEILTEAIEGAPTPYAIQVVAPNEETWKLCTMSKEDQQRWIRSIEKFQGSKATQGPSSPASDEEFEKKKGDLESTASPKANRDVPDSTQSLDFPSARVVETVENKVSVTSANPGPTLVKDTIVRGDSNKAATSLPKAPVTSAAQAKKTGQKKRLKLAGTKNLIEQETAEGFLVLAILNLCMLGILRSSCPSCIFCYFAIANYVTYHTLQLRAKRVKQVPTNAQNHVASVDEIAEKSSEVPKTDSVLKSEGTVDIVEPTLEVNPENKLAPAQSSLNQKPIPGATYVKAGGDPRQAPLHTWSMVDHRQFNVRIGPDYNRYKRKAASAAPIYEPFAVDVFCTKLRVDHAATRFQLPDTSDINTNHPFVPALFVVQIQIPSEPPPSFFATNEDGPGWAVVMYFRITEDACRQLKDIANASPAVKLFAQWCEKAPNDPAWRGRFKVINSCTNLSEMGFPSVIESYNAKPVLIRRTGSIFRGSNYMEMNIHVHKFANIAKQSIYLLSSKCAQLYMQIGFVIEGRDDSELPETLFACVAINRPQEDLAEFIFED